MIVASKNIKKYLEVAGITAREFAERIGFDEQTVSQVLSGKESPSSNFIESVLSKTGMDFEKAFEIKE